jgi:hypothetical protein
MPLDNFPLFRKIGAAGKNEGQASAQAFEISREI